VHLFILYWGMVSFITPPVALANFAAASIARASPFAIGTAAVKLGSVIYFVPFLFVYNPELLLKGATSDVVLTITTAFLGVFFFAAGLQGYAIGGGKAEGPIGAIARIMLIGAGILGALAGIPQIGLTHLQCAAMGIALGVAAIVLLRATGARRSSAL
jgi:TRAP-type uncharacterized transport system fused permease subunit